MNVMMIMFHTVKDLINIECPDEDDDDNVSYSEEYHQYGVP